MGAVSFRGWPPEAFEFYAGLEVDNSRAWFAGHRETFETAVRGPFTALAAELADRYGTFHVYRPHRDLRFSADKSPYKTHQGAVTETEGGVSLYLQISAEGLYVGAGIWAPARDQLERYRRAVADERTGPELATAVADLRRRRYEVTARATLKTAPRGWPRDHPRIDLLRHKGLVVGRAFGIPAWVHTRRALRRIRDTWDGAGPVITWLERHVGPSELPPCSWRD